VRHRLGAAVIVIIGVFAASPSVVPAGASGPMGRLTLAQTARQSPTFRIGFAKEVVDPSPADVASGNFHLGGYGILPTRATTGPMVLPDGTPEHLYARAMAIVNGRGQALLLADVENQGTFTAYKQCACGIWDVRQQVAADTQVPVDSIVVNSDHSHSGPDLIGLWGGVPVDYLHLVHDQTVRALEDALAGAVPAHLLAGSSVPTMPTPDQGRYVKGSATPGEDLVHSQFSKDGLTGYDDSAVDTELRVLQAVTPSGELLGTLVNYAAHATTTGSGNLLYSADWPGWVARKTEQALGEPVAVTMVADVGRSQPPRPFSVSPCGTGYRGGCDADKLDTYSRIMLPFVVGAVSGASPVTGDMIANREVFTREPATNAALLGVSYSGEAPVNGYGAYRAATPPWATGDVIGTFVSAHRVGDVLLTAAPGEAYPDMRFALGRSVRGASRVFTFGLANDQLGYLIGPTSEYGWITVSQPGNDNSFFNVSPAYGDHVLCTQTAAATAIGFVATGNSSPYGPGANEPACPAYNAADQVPMGAAPQQPWPFGNGVPGPTP
jgi:hypothetical protein